MDNSTKWNSNQLPIEYLISSLIKPVFSKDTYEHSEMVQNHHLQYNHWTICNNGYTCLRKNNINKLD